MFNLSLIEHTLPLPPDLLNLPLTIAVKGELEKLFLDKVITNLGLCVSIYDIRSIEGGFVVPGDGSPTYEVVFRLVMFQPIVKEVLTGKIEASDENGLRVSLGFFKDVYIPCNLLPQPCKRGSDGIWMWDYSDGALALDLDEEILFRVKTVKYPPIPVTQDENAKPFAPMEIIGDISEEGLGVISWWRGEPESTEEPE